MSITTVYVQRAKGDDPEAKALLHQIHLQGYQCELINLERVLRIEGEVNIEEIVPLLVNLLYENFSVESQLDPTQGPVIEIGYQLAVTDPETPSILEGAKALGIQNLDWVRLSFRYQFVGVSQSEAETIASWLYNPQVHILIKPESVWESLRPSGTPEPLKTISLLDLDDKELLALSQDNSWYMPLSQLQVLQKFEQGRGHPFTDAEIEIFAQSWSDHCYHTTWKSLGLLQLLSSATNTINHPSVVSALHDNAGGIRFYDGWVLVIKGETHNFPSSIAPFGGVATKHGGVIRDILGFGQGAYPIGGTTIMGTMDPKMSAGDVPQGALPPRLILSESIRATAFYLNPMGIPMYRSVYRCHPGYAKCLALGHSIGLTKEEFSKKEDPRPGDAMILLGGKTGRDGIHGATASSAAMTQDTGRKDAAAVQIGHPIVERKFTTAIPKLQESDCIRSLTDLGAGGISCAAGEMAAKTGAVIYLERIPLKDESLSAWEILLSESQERMLLAVPPEKVELCQRICPAFGVEATVIGQFSATKRFIVWQGQEQIVDIPLEFLWGSCPIDPLEVRKPQRYPKPANLPEPSTQEEWQTVMKKLLCHCHCCDQSSAGFQFDSTVQGRTVVGPYGGKIGKMPTDATLSAPLRGKPYGAVFSVAYNPFYAEIDPAGMARLGIVEAVSKQVAVGVDYRQCVLCDNFYTPKASPEVAFDLKVMVETIAECSQSLGIPFIAGKDSSSGTFTAEDGRKIEVPLTLVVSALGRMPDVRKAVTKEFKEPGHALILVGEFIPPQMGGSVYLDIFGQRGDKLPDQGPEWEKRLGVLWDKLHKLIHLPTQPIKAVSAIGEGGLFLRLFEMAYGGNLGALVDFTCFDRIRRDALLFGEMIGCFLLEVDSPNWSELFSDVPHWLIGRTIPDKTLLFADKTKPLCAVSIEELAENWAKPFREVIG